MSISVTCACGRRFEAPDADAGCVARCPDCGRESIVPKPPAVEEVMFIGPEANGRRNSGKAIASLVLGVCFFFACFTGLPAIALGIGALDEIGKSGGRLKGRGMAIAGIWLGLLGCLVTLAFFLPAVRSAREAARRSQCVNNLKQIGLALHNYEAANGTLPPAAITDKTGRPLLSWRVALLPYLESRDLYARFRLDEPWDSPHNLALLDSMPGVFACPSNPTPQRGMTGYVAVIGNATAFRPDFRPVRFSDITDGLSNTLLVGESRRWVPWTKPDDLPFDPGASRNGLGSHHGYHNNGFNVLLGEGSVRFVKSTISPQDLRAILTRNGNEPYTPRVD